mgnify:FL=1
MTLRNKTCKDYAIGLKRTAGWIFFDMLHTFFGNGTLIFIGEGEDGKDIEIAATDKWLAANHGSNFEITIEMATSFIPHMDSCRSPGCVESMKLYKELRSLLQGEVLPGGTAIDIISKCAGKGYDERTAFSREAGTSEFIDGIMPFLKWFTGENKAFWAWPDEESHATIKD